MQSSLNIKLGQRLHGQKEREVESMASIYTSITEETVKGSKNRAYAALDMLTNGKADMAIALVLEYKELDDILEELKKQQH